MQFPKATPHGEITQLEEDLFVVHGSVDINPVIRFPRNMTIVRRGDVLTLISPVRLDEAGLADLDALGEVRHVLRLGPLHGLDDPFYLDRYQAKFWSVPGGTTYPIPDDAHILTEGGQLPFCNADLFMFADLNQPEGIIRLNDTNGVLLSVDSVQSYATPPHKPYANLLARMISPLIGFPNKTLVGPVWVKMMTDNPAALRAEFTRLLALDFDALLSAHGTYLATGAKQALEQAVNERFDG